MKDIPKLQPQLSDEERDRAHLALQKVDDLADKIAGQSRQLEQNHRELFGAMPGESREKVIWRGIIGFANAANLDRQVTHAQPEERMAREKEIEKFLLLLVFCTQGHFTREDFLPSCSEVSAIASKLGVTSELAFHFLCVQYQPQLKRLLAWLCAPHRQKELSSEAVNFLWKHALGVRDRLAFTEANFDESSRNYCPVFYWKTVQYQSAMSPICKFILDRIERYHDQEIELEEAVPIRICDRPDCGRFLLPQRVGRKKFCSKTCLILAQPGRTVDENRDYMWLYRLEQEPLAVLRAKLKLPARKQRLARIKSDWPDLADKVMKLKQRAGR